MATKIDTIERDGRLVNIYDNGAEQDATTGRFIKPARGVAFTPETAKLARRKRQEKFARLLRQRIRETHNAVMPHPVQTSAEAFAEAAAMLHEQVVLNSEAYPRDRLEALDKIGKYAEVVPADRKEQEADEAAARAAALNAAAAGMTAETAALLVRILNDVQKVKRGEAIDGKVIE
jgi:hypothetical protein